MTADTDLTALPRRALGVENVKNDLEGRTATVVGWGYTSGYDPWLGKIQVGRDCGGLKQ